MKFKKKKKKSAAKQDDHDPELEHWTPTPRLAASRPHAARIRDLDLDLDLWKRKRSVDAVYDLVMDRFAHKLGPGVTHRGSNLLRQSASEPPMCIKAQNEHRATSPTFNSRPVSTSPSRMFYARESPGPQRKVSFRCELEERQVGVRGDVNETRDLDEGDEKEEQKSELRMQTGRISILYSADYDILLFSIFNFKPRD